MRLQSTTLTLILVLIAPTFVASAANADLVLCQKGEKLKVRQDKCKRKKGEKLISLEDLGFVPGQGPPGAPGTARGYAQIDSVDNGLRLIDEMTSNVDSVTSPIAGVYCVIPDAAIDRESFPAIVSVQHSLGNQSQVGTTVRVRYPFVCQDNNAYEVLTIRLDPGSANGGKLVDDIGFNIVIP
jgi:hypothetical protein